MVPAAIARTISTTTFIAPRGNRGIEFALRMGRALHAHGTPSHRLEDALNRLCHRLDLRAVFFSTPTALFASFETDHSAPEVHLLRVGGKGINLGRLAELDQIANRVIDGELSPLQGLEQIDALESTRPPFGARWLIPSYALNSAAACLFLGGGFRESAVAGVLGLVTGLIATLGSRSGRPFTALEATASFFVALIATLLAKLLGPFALPSSILSGLVALLPGYTLTVAMTELAKGHLASGSARLTGAAMTFLALGFGVAFGNRVAEWGLGVVPAGVAEPVPGWALTLAVPLAVVTFAFLFQARFKDVPWIVLASLAGLAGVSAGTHWLGPGLGSFLGAFAVTMVSNFYGRRLNRPAVVPLFPSLMLLVPGSIGFRSFSSLMEQDVVSGVQTAFQMILVAVALVAGLLVANDVFPPRRAL